MWSFQEGDYILYGKSIGIITATMDGDHWTDDYEEDGDSYCYVNFFIDRDDIGVDEFAVYADSHLIRVVGDNRKIISHIFSREFS